MALSKHRSRRKIDTGGVDMTPMLDIVFILLIFFVVTAVFVDEDGIDLRQANRAECDCPPGETPIGVYLFADGRASLDGQLLSVTRIPNRVQSLRAERPNAAVILRANSKAPHGNLVFLKDQLDRVDVPVVIKVETPL